MIDIFRISLFIKIVFLCAASFCGLCQFNTYTEYHFNCWIFGSLQYVNECRGTPVHEYATRKKKQKKKILFKNVVTNNYEETKKIKLILQINYTSISYHMFNEVVVASLDNTFGRPFAHCTRQTNDTCRQ